MKKLFIFTPSKQWTYCGGVAMATGESYEKAVEKLNKEIYNSYRFQHNETLKDDDHIWVLTKEIVLQDGQEDFVLVNYNYA